MSPVLKNPAKVTLISSTNRMTQFRVVLISQALILLSRISCTVSDRAECSCNPLSDRQRFLCEYSEHGSNQTKTYPLSDLPENLSGPFTFFIGDVQWTEDRKLAGYDYDVPCPAKPKLRINEIMRIPAVQTRSVTLINFDFMDERALQIPPLLSNIKTNLFRLEILCGALRTIRSGMFGAFPNLSELHIRRTGLKHVEHGSFDGFSALEDLDISNNAIDSFDWSVMRPFAASLDAISLDFNNMTRIHTSTPIFFPSLTSVGLNENQLRIIPPEIVDTWPTNSSTFFNVFLDGNPLCPEDKLCRCCSLVPLLQFARKSGAWVGNYLWCGGLQKRYCGVKDIPRMHESLSCEGDCWTTVNITGVIGAAHYDSCGSNTDSKVMACKMQ